MTAPHSNPALVAKSSLLVALAFGVPTLRAAEGADLTFDPTRYTEQTVKVGDQTVAYRAYEGIVYVAHPADAQYQSLNFYVPTAYFEGKSIAGYTAETAPIFLPNTVGGYMPGRPGTPVNNGRPGGPGLPPNAPQPPAALAGPGGPDHPPAGPMPAGVPGPDGSQHPNTIAAALAHGYVVAAPGARGRTSKDSAGTYTGKAPACIVDLKAAVRYLRHNDPLMPGDANKIVSNGTSAGGALSALLGATGNSTDYAAYLQALGAADERDDIFAASCYCPITNLDHADAAYEWLFNGINDYTSRGQKATMDARQIALSAELKPLFPAYLNSLALRAPDGAALTLDAAGDGSFKDYVKSFVIASAQRALASGTDLSSLPWITVKADTVTDLDFARYLAFATRMKTTPAFDSLELRSPENNLFGTATVDSQHFTAFASEHSTDHTLAAAALVKQMNPLNYIGADGVATAPHWRIRHGAVDRDTSLAIPVILATTLQNRGYDVDFALPWGIGHAGDYDLAELFAWIDGMCRPAK